MHDPVQTEGAGPYIHFCECPATVAFPATTLTILLTKTVRTWHTCSPTWSPQPHHTLLPVRQLVHAAAAFLETEPLPSCVHSTLNQTCHNWADETRVPAPLAPFLGKIEGHTMRVSMLCSQGAPRHHVYVWEGPVKHST